MNSLAKTMSYVLVLGFLFCACVRRVPTAPMAQPTPESIWNFSASLDVRLEVDGLSREDGEWLLSLGTFRNSIEGRIIEGPFRINRDHTESWRLLFEEVLNSEGHSLPLEGYAVETRRFGSGPLLAIQQTEHASGPGPMVDALDPLLALLFLLPPEGVGEEAVYGQLAWPFRIDSGRKSHHFSTLKWTKETAETDVPGGSVYRYEGLLSGKGKDRFWDSTLAIQGHIEGAILFDAAGEIQQHSFLVERNQSWRIPGERSLRQVQQLRGQFSTRLGSVVVPWERLFYLSESDVLEALSLHPKKWESCSPHPDFVVPMQFVVERDGRAVVSEGFADGLQDCAEVLASVRFPKHHQAGLKVDTQLVIQEGRFVPYPKALLSKRFSPPAHLLLGVNELSSEDEVRLTRLLTGSGVQQ